MQAETSRLKGDKKMLNIFLGESEKCVINPPMYFDLYGKAEWLNDPLAKEMILDIDKTEVKSPFEILSPVFGYIHFKQLSGGVKTLLLLAFLEREKRFDITVCGENCAKWIEHIGELKDITVDLKYCMRFTDNIHAKILNTGHEIHSFAEFLKEYNYARNYQNTW